MIASFTALNTLNPRRNKIYSHLFSIIPGKEPAMEHETKLENEDEPKTVLTKKKEERKQKHPPQLSTSLYFAFKSHLHKLPRIKLTVK